MTFCYTRYTNTHYTHAEVRSYFNLHEFIVCFCLFLADEVSELSAAVRPLYGHLQGSHQVQDYLQVLHTHLNT